MNNVLRRDNTPMPKVANLPGAPQAPARPPQPVKQPVTEVYDPEVLRIVQADVDRKRKIAELESDRDEWRRQALDAKQEINRLQMVISRDAKEFEEAIRKERAENEEIVERVTHERDVFKGEVVRVRTCAQNGAAVFLQILDQGLSNAPGEKAGLSAVAAAIEADDPMFREVDEPEPEPAPPMPRVVTQGPREGQ